MKNWVKKQIGAFMLATSKVEQNALSQDGELLSNETTKHQRHNQGTLLDDLKQGVVTVEVENLRWRMYKVLDAVNKNTKQFKVVGYDETDNPIVETYERKTNSQSLSSVKLSDDNPYELELLIYNDAITNSFIDSMDDIDTKQERPIIIERDFTPKFYIENYIKKLHVRNIDSNTKLIELYISKYPNEFDRKTKLLISEINRFINNQRSSNIFDIMNINFVTYKSIGCEDFNEFEYKINIFNSITEFDGYYVIKYNCDVIKEREYLLEKYRMTELDIKYDNKEKR
jgi:hypothetical protein